MENPPSFGAGFFDYQLAFVTPGIMPESAICLKHILHRPKRLRYARLRPHRMHLWYALVLNLGVLRHFSIAAFLAT